MKKYMVMIIIAFTFTVVLGQSFTEVKKKAEQGYATAQFNLGVMYYQGEGTLRDPKQALHWHKKSAEQGYTKAQFNLGAMYYQGEGTLKDPKQALHWYKKCAAQGCAKAQYNLGVMYYYGEGTLEDRKQTAYWMKKAYENKNEGEKINAKAFWDKFNLWKYTD